MLNKLLRQLVLKKNIYLSGEKLDSLRFNLLKKQLSFAYQNIPFYKSEFIKAGVNPDNLSSIHDLIQYPIITKDTIRANSSQLLKKRLLGNKLKSHTSGSTGQPMWTYYDISAWIRKKYLAKIRARFECGIKIFDKIVIFEPLTAAQVKKRNRKLISSFTLLQFKVFSIYEPYNIILDQLENFAPQALYGPPNYFFQLAKLMIKNNFKLPSVKRIFTSSEYLQENVRRFLEDTFDAEVFDIYGSTEFKEVAWECEKHEGYHINEDEVIVEILKDGEPVNPGIAGNIVITDLRNNAMPLIRYQMQDKGMLIKNSCSCGRTFSMMKPLAGRSSEYIILPDGEILSPYLFTTNLELINGLLQYQIIQISENKIIVNIVTTGEEYSRVAAGIKEILNEILKSKIEVEVALKNNINIEENGKFKVVKNLLLETKGVNI